MRNDRPLSIKDENERLKRDAASRWLLNKGKLRSKSQRRAWAHDITLMEFKGRGQTLSHSMFVWRQRDRRPDEQPRQPVAVGRRPRHA